MKALPGCSAILAALRLVPQERERRGRGTGVSCAFGWRAQDGANLPCVDSAEARFEDVCDLAFDPELRENPIALGIDHDLQKPGSCR